MKTKLTKMLVVLVVLTVSINLKAQDDDRDDMWDRINAGLPVKDFGMTDEVHPNHKKEIVFSKTPLEFQNVKESQLASTFNLGDDIYFMAYFERSMYNQAFVDKIVDYKKVPFDINTYSAWEVFTFSVNGVDNIVGTPIRWAQGILDEYYLTWTGRSQPDRSITQFEEMGYNSSIGRQFNQYVVPCLKKGENTVKFNLSYILYYQVENGKKDLEFIPQEPMASGEFKIMVKDDMEVKNYLATWPDIQIKKGMSNPAMETEIKNLELAKRSETPHKIIIESTDWYVEQDAYVIKYRTLTYSAVYKTSNPLFYKVIKNVLRQDYQGSGKFGRSFLEQAELETLIPVCIIK
jgi:hypothetical protein